MDWNHKCSQLKITLLPPWHPLLAKECHLISHCHMCKLKWEKQYHSLEVYEVWDVRGHSQVIWGYIMITISCSGHEMGVMHRQGRRWPGQSELIIWSACHNRNWNIHTLQSHARKLWDTSHYITKAGFYIDKERAGYPKTFPPSQFTNEANIAPTVLPIEPVHKVLVIWVLSNSWFPVFISRV